MNDSELEAMLKTARVPERPAAYWENFPARVLSKLRRSQAQPPERASWLAPVAWGSAVALACLALGFCIGRADPREITALVQREKQLRCEVAAAPKQLCVLMQSGHNLRGLVSDVQ